MGQAVGQGVITACKACYLSKVFVRAVAVAEGDADAVLEKLAWAWGDVVTEERMNGIWKETLKRFAHDFRGFAKDEEVAEISKALVELANNLSSGVAAGDIEELLEVVPEEPT